MVLVHHSCVVSARLWPDVGAVPDILRDPRGAEGQLSALPTRLLKAGRLGPARPDLLQATRDC